MYVQSSAGSITGKIRYVDTFFNLLGKVTPFRPLRTPFIPNDKQKMNKNVNCQPLWMSLVSFCRVFKKAYYYITLHAD